MPKKLTQEDFSHRVGETFTNKNGESCKIVEYFNATNCTIEFEDGCVIKNRWYANIVKGAFRNPNLPTYYGVGFQGVGKYTFAINRKIGDVWIRMFQRGYDKKLHDKQPSYKDCSVVKEWHNFQVFAEWFDENYKEGFVLDKDILLKGNKIYSPDTCVFVPREINGIFTLRQNKRGDYPIGVLKNGNKFQANIVRYNKREYLGTFNTPEEAFQVYKVAKEDYIRHVANKWKNQITEECYQALLNYKIEIID